MDTENLLRKAGYQILGKNVKEKVVITINGQDHLGLLEAPFLVRQEKKDYVVVAKDSEPPLDPREPGLRRELIEYQRFFGLDNILLVNIKNKEIQKITLQFPKEKGLDYFFQFLGALFIVAVVAGIIWLMAYLKLY